MSFAEVANPTPTQHTSAAAVRMTAMERFFIFIMAMILSSIAFLLNALAKGSGPLRFSSMDSRARA